MTILQEEIRVAAPGSPRPRLVLEPALEPPREAVPRPRSAAMAVLSTAGAVLMLTFAGLTLAVLAALGINGARFP